MIFKGCTLAKDYDFSKHRVQGWFMSEKLDGMRAIWLGTKGGMVTRTGKPIYIPQSLHDELSLLGIVGLDGELWLGRGRFQDTMSIARRKEADSRWDDIQYRVFDVMAPGNWVARTSAVCSYMPKDSRIQFHPHEIITNDEQVLDRAAKIIAEGGEGIMLRNPRAPYEYKRTGDLLKVKGVIDGIAQVCGVIPGEGKHSGRMGALQCLEASSDGLCLCQPLVSFSVGTGFSDACRERTDWVGKIIRWSAHERTDAGKPRHPRFVSIFEE